MSEEAYASEFYVTEPALNTLEKILCAGVDPAIRRSLRRRQRPQAGRDFATVGSEIGLIKSPNALVQLQHSITIAA